MNQPTGTQVGLTDTIKCAGCQRSVSFSDWDGHNCCLPGQLACKYEHDSISGYCDPCRGEALTEKLEDSQHEVAEAEELLSQARTVVYAREQHLIRATNRLMLADQRWDAWNKGEA